ncbi:MAG: hypothetical protein QXP53_01825 [Candidatus Pacearchaeota archaeon]
MTKTANFYARSFPFPVTKITNGYFDELCSCLEICCSLIKEKDKMVCSFHTGESIALKREQPFGWSLASVTYPNKEYKGKEVTDFGFVFHRLINVYEDEKKNTQRKFRIIPEYLIDIPLENYEKYGTFYDNWPVKIFSFQAPGKEDTELEKILTSFFVMKKGAIPIQPNSESKSLLYPWNYKIDEITIGIASSKTSGLSFQIDGSASKTYEITKEILGEFLKKQKFSVAGFILCLGEKGVFGDDLWKEVEKETY